jgi:hypothetical protein
VRRDAYQEIKAGMAEGGDRKRVAVGIKNLSRYAIVLGVAGASTNMVQDFIMGRPITFTGTDIAENMLKTFGWSHHVQKELAEGNLVGGLGTLIVPPYRIMDDIIKRDPRAISYVPILGKVYYGRELGGNERAEISQARREGKSMKDLSPKAERYLEKKREEAEDRRDAR